MSELRVPVAALPAEVLCTDGSVMRGRIFVPATAAGHEGPTLPDEWMNRPARFFPFLPDGDGRPLLLNKATVVAVTVPAWADEADPEMFAPAPEREVVVECGGRSFRGMVALELPEHQRRVLDLLNQPGGFLTVRSTEHHHLIAKHHITRVVELAET
ncbi:MAG: hypothetical protein ACOY3Y_20145 [Acidobacteriota bacterium]